MKSRFVDRTDDLLHLPSGRCCCNFIAYQVDANRCLHVSDCQLLCRDVTWGVIHSERLTSGCSVVAFGVLYRFVFNGDSSADTVCAASPRDTQKQCARVHSGENRVPSVPS